MLTFVLRRLLSIPLLLLVISFLTFVLLKSAPGDYFQALEEDPAKLLSYVMRLREDAGLVKRMPAEKLESLGSIVALQQPKTPDDDPIELVMSFDAEGRLCDPEGEVVDRFSAKALLSRFTVKGRDYRLDEDGIVYIAIGPIEGYGRWLKRLVTGFNMGTSYSKKQPVGDLITERVTNTLILSISSLMFAWIVAIPLGVISAIRPNSLIDHICGFISYFGLSIPSVFFALLAILFAAYTEWFPVGNMRDLTRLDMTGWESFKDVAWHLVLPTFVIGTGTLAGYMRQMRGEMVETLSKDYVRTARAKGLSARAVLFKHALRNAINPLVTLFGFSLAALLSGSFLVEVVMNWPGMARLVVDAIFAKDEPLVMASVMMAAVLLMLGNLTADILLALVDPRIRLE